MKTIEQIYDEVFPYKQGRPSDKDIERMMLKYAEDVLQEVENKLSVWSDTYIMDDEENNPVEITVFNSRYEMFKESVTKIR